MTHRRQNSRTQSGSKATSINLPFLAHHVELVDVNALTVGNRSLRRHSDAKLHKLRANIELHGMIVPLVANATGRVLAGEARLSIARQLGLSEVPVIRVSHLTKAQEMAFTVADNRIVELSSWDEASLKITFEEIIALDESFEIEVTGFDTAQIDRILEVTEGADADDPDDELMLPEEEAVSRKGDLWIIGNHRLLCGDATDANGVLRLLDGDVIDQTVTDPPYNVQINGHVRGKSGGHREFVQGSGEMSACEYEAFLRATIAVVRDHSRPGALAYVFNDWRHIEVLLRSGRLEDTFLINLCCWNKSNAGMGSFYRSKHELCAVFKIGDAPHINTIMLGSTGRYRTNVWDYPGVNSFGADRANALEMHPTVKPVAMIVDIIKDASRRGDVIFDPFAGSGTTIIAAQRTGRRCRAIELDPRYVDTIIRRCRTKLGLEAVHAETGLTWSAMVERCSIPTDPFHEPHANPRWRPRPRSASGAAR